MPIEESIKIEFTYDECKDIMEYLYFNIESYREKAQKYMDTQGYRNDIFFPTIQSMNHIRNRFVEARSIIREKRKGK